VLLIIIFLCVILLCVFTFCVPCCDVRRDFRMEIMFGWSMATVVCMRALRCLCLFACCVFLFCISSSCVPCMASFS
jgi:hypothetical protein